MYKLFHPKNMSIKFFKLKYQKILKNISQLLKLTTKISTKS